MIKVEVKIKNESGYPLPVYKTKQSSGCDLVAVLGHPVLLQPLDRVFINTHVSIELPEGYEAQVRSRSGLNWKHGIVCPTGTIDSDYRGEIGVILYNLSHEPYVIHAGDSIAQLVICPYVQAEWNEVEDLDESERGQNGFGSTGK